MENSLTQITSVLRTQSSQIAILAVIIAAVSLLLKDKSAHIRYLLWLVLLAKCLVPPLLTIPLAILPQEQIIETATATPALFDGPAVYEPANPVSALSVSADSTIFDRFAALTMSQWLALAWSLGVVLFALIAGTKAIRLNHWLKTVRKPLDADLLGAIRALFTEINDEKFPKVWLVEGIGQPFVWGLLRGQIYLPSNFADIKAKEHRRAILSHELSHVMRFDAAVNLLQIIVQALFWFHPLIWWANKQIRAEREKCCDEMAIAWLGAKAREFSTAIVNVLTAEHKAPQPIPSLAVAGPVKNIEDRIKTIMNPSKKFYKHPGIRAVITILLVALIALPTTLVLTCRSPETAVLQRTPKKVELAFAELIGAVRENDSAKLQEIAIRQVEAFNLSDEQKEHAIYTLQLDAIALRTYTGIEDLQIYTIEKQNGRTNLLTSEVTDARGVTGRLSFGIFGKDKVILDGFAFVENDGTKLGLRPQILTSAYVLTVPADLPQLKGIISDDGTGSGAPMITPEKLEEFLKVVRSNPQAKMISMPRILTNDGEAGEISTGDAKDVEYIRLDIKSTAKADRKTIRLQLEFEYSRAGADGRQATSIATMAILLSDHTIAVAGGACDDGNRMLLLVTPKILERQSPKTDAAQSKAPPTPTSRRRLRE